MNFIFGLLIGVVALAVAIADANERGIMVCSGPGDMFIETITMIEQTRYKTNSSLPIVVAHCNELTPPLIEILAGIPNVKEMNLCRLDPIYAHLQHRIKGFFCKPAAILASPFAETMIVDSDVIWFDNPDKLFDAQVFRDTGTLFFRDRWTRTRNKLTLTKGTQNPMHLMNYIRGMIQSAQNNKEILHNPKVRFETKESHTHPATFTELDANRVDAKGLSKNNAYWHDNALGRSDTSLDHWQDSSVIVICKSAHPRLLSVLLHMLRDFNIGYGDKEMYWIAATISGEPFGFEPHLTGALGDCGAIVHFDPTVITTEQIESKPFYINAEYLVDLAKLKAAGDFISLESTNPFDAVVSRPVAIIESTAKLYSLSPWKNMKHGFYPCSSCQHAKCAGAPKYIVEEIIQRQEFILALKAVTSTGSQLDKNMYRQVRSRLSKYFEKPLLA